MKIDMKPHNPDQSVFWNAMKELGGVWGAETAEKIESGELAFTKGILDHFLQGEYWNVGWRELSPYLGVIVAKYMDFALKIRSSGDREFNENGEEIPQEYEIHNFID